MKQYILIDGHSILYRSYYAFIRNPLRNSKGFNTSAIYGFMNLLQKLEKKFNPEFMAVTFDTGEKTFRHEQYEDYKATRKPPPDDLPPQIPVIKKLVRALGIKTYELEGYEADDLLATIAKSLAEKGEVYIVTFDKDLLQLVGNNVYVFDPYRNYVYDEDAVVDKFGVTPENIVDLLAIAGDASDNVPGIPGYGLKKAKTAIQKFGSADGAVTGDPKLTEYKEKVNFYKLLLTVDKDVPIEVGEVDIKITKRDEKVLSEIFHEMEFYKLMREFFGKEERGDYKDGAGIMKEGKYGIESDSQIFVSNKAGVARSYKRNQKNIECVENSELVGFSIKKIMKDLNIKPAKYTDIELSALLINPDRYLKPQDIILGYLNIAVDPISPYQLADFALRLASIIGEKIKGLGLQKASEIEHKLLPVIIAMENRGIKIHADRLTSLRAEINKELSALEFEINQLAGRPFNINSPRQLANILFNILGLKPGKKKKTGYSTDSSVLIELSQYHPLPSRILSFREKSKLLSTYLNPIYKKIVKENNRIHTTFNQLGASTGRLSSSNPNLQNIPPILKKIFVPEAGHKFISADYSQIELRILAHLSDDKNLIAAFKEGIDIHDRTAQEIFDIRRDEIMREHRRIAKMVNYGIIYGLSEFGLADGLKVSREDAHDIIERHRRIYADAHNWISEHIENTEDKGETRTLIGRRRIFNSPLTGAKIRSAINSPIQGTAADLIKMAMITIEEDLSRQGIEKGIILQVHDELLLEVNEEDLDKAVDIVRHEMEDIYRLKVPILVNIGVGDDWYEAH